VGVVNAGVGRTGEREDGEQGGGQCEDQTESEGGVHGDTLGLLGSAGVVVHGYAGARDGRARGQELGTPSERSTG